MNSVKLPIVFILITYWSTMSAGFQSTYITALQSIIAPITHGLRWLQEQWPQTAPQKTIVITSAIVGTYVLYKVIAHCILFTRNRIIETADQIEDYDQSSGTSIEGYQPAHIPLPDIEVITPIPEPIRHEIIQEPVILPVQEHIISEIHSTLAVLPAKPSTSMGRIDALVLPATCKLVVMGDIHGDPESLYNNMQAMYQYGIIDSSLKLGPNWYLIVTGDLADRGSDGHAVWQTIMQLIRTNIGHVHIMRGNHETDEVTQCMEFKAELSLKYGYLYDHIYKEFLRLFDHLAGALCVGLKRPFGVEPEFIIFCHGGIEKRLTKQFTEVMNKAKIDGQASVHFGREELGGYAETICALNWGDFRAIEHADPDEIPCQRTSGNGVFTHNKAFACDYLASFRQAGLYVRSLIRGHDHTPGGITELREKRIVQSALGAGCCREKMEQFRPMNHNRSEIISDGSIYTCTSSPAALFNIGCSEDAFATIDSTDQGPRITPHIKFRVPQAAYSLQ